MTSCKYHSGSTTCVCDKWGRWPESKARSLAIGITVFSIVAAIFGGVYYGYYGYSLLNGLSTASVRGAAFVITTWAVSLILAGVGGGALFWYRNDCLHSHKSMCEWFRVSTASLSFILLFTLFPLFFWSVSPFASALAMFVAFGVSFLYVRNSMAKFTSWSGAFWFEATFVAIGLAFYSLAFTFRI